LGRPLAGPDPRPAAERRGVRWTKQMLGRLVLTILTGLLLGVLVMESSACRAYRSLKERIEGAEYVVVGELSNVREGFTIFYPEDWRSYWRGLRVTYLTGDLAVSEVLQGDRLYSSIPIFYYSHSAGNDGSPVLFLIHDRSDYPQGEPGIWLLDRSDVVGAYLIRGNDCHLPMDSLAVVRKYAVLKKGRR
jgi:hypothetical protein